MTYQAELNDFLSMEDECITTLSGKRFADPEKCANLGWDIMARLAAIHDAKVENQGDQFMVYRPEGTYDPEKEDGVLYTMRVLNEEGVPFEL